MTFDEYFKKLAPDQKNSYAYLGWEGIYNLMEDAWNASKEDSKLEVGIVWSSIVEDWSVRDFQDGVTIEDGFDSEEKAKEWALQKGYRVVE